MTKTVLTVDDSRTMRDMLMLALKDAGYRVVQAEDGVHGLEVLQAENPDIVITDINMPRMDGFGLIAEVRGQGRRSLPILVLTARDAVGDRVDVYRPGRREPVAEDARVVAVPDDGDDLSVTSEPTAVLALPAAAAGDIVDALGSDATTGFVLTTRSASTGP